MTQRYANVSEVPLALAVFLASDYYDYSSDPTEVSATTLLKPLRQVILPSRVPAGEGLVPLIAMLKNRMGTAIHDSIERAWLTNHGAAMQAIGYPQHVIDRILINPTEVALSMFPNAIPIYLEQRLKRQVGKWTVTGKFDFVGEGRVQDFKSTSVWAYMNQTNNEKWAMQGSIYRWLNDKLITQDELDIHYILTDWKAGMVRSDPNYPKAPMLRQVFPLKSVRETQAFIERKLADIEQYWDAHEADIPPCNDEELWRGEAVFKYYKNPAKTGRSTKNFDSLHDARVHFIADGSVGLIKEVPGEVTACKYCAAFVACTQKDALIASGDLVMA